MNKVLSRLACPELPRTCCPKRKDSEQQVQSGLSLTPSDIERMANQGIAVSTPAADMFRYDSDDSWNIPPEYLRDSDRNTMWELSQVSKQRIMNARKRDKERFT